MDYLETCGMCGGEGHYDQTYTAGCGGGYFTTKGPCDYCGETGIRTINNTKVSRSHLAQIETRRAAALRAKEADDATD
jgi:DnaJ-class molecular chaperone